MCPRGWVEVQLFSSMTAAPEGGEWSAARPGRTLLPGKTRYTFYRWLGGPQGRSGRAENLVPNSIRFRTVQPVVSRYTDCATRPTYMYICTRWFKYDRDWFVCKHKMSVPVIFEPPCIYIHTYIYIYIYFEEKLSTKIKHAFYVNHILSVRVTALVVTKQK